MAGITPQQGASLSEAVYAENLWSYVGTKNTISDNYGGNYQVIDVSSPFISNGFRGALFKNTQTDQYVVAFAGTNPNPNDMITNVSMFFHNVQNGVPDQFTSAGKFLSQMISKYDELNASNTTIVGHSEGASEAMYIGSNFGFTTYTYNAYGIGNMDGLRTFTSNIHNYVTYLDFVSRLPGSVMIGATTMVGDTTFANKLGHGIANFTSEESIA